VAVFKQKRADTKFQATLSHLEQLVSECIEDYRNLDEAHMGLHMEELSRLQLEAFQEMIPSKLRQVWETGLNERQFAIKLCGAGGGGYFIGYKLRGPCPGNVILF
jgi:mevalonate kinase